MVEISLLVVYTWVNSPNSDILKGGIQCWMDKRNYRFIQKRKELGLTQEALTERVGLSQSMIAHIEPGNKAPRKKYTMALARLMGVPVEWLFYEQLEDQYMTDQYGVKS